MRALICLFFLIGGVQLSLAQTDLELKILALFESKHDAIDVQYFHGRVDAMQEVGMAFACVGKDCRGVLRYIRSKEELLLLGSKKKDQIFLEEINNFGKKSGTLTATLSGNELEGWWADPEENAYSSYKLIAVENIPAKATPCGKDKWIRHFTTADKSSHILLQKSNANALVGWYYAKDRNKRLLLEGGLGGDGYFELMIFDETTEVGNLVGTFKEKGVQNILIDWSDGEKNQIQFESKDRLIYGCIEYGDFLSYFSMTYPLTRHQNFNTWMEKKVSHFASTSKKYGSEVRKENPTLHPNLRSSLHANAWTEINFINENFISGVLNFSNNWSQKEKDESFIFNFNNGKHLTIEDIFSNSNEVLKLVENRKKELSENNSDSQEYFDWIAQESFDLINVQYEGISFASRFHPIFGREKILLTYSELKPYLMKVGGVSSVAK